MIFLVQLKCFKSIQHGIFAFKNKSVLHVFFASEISSFEFEFLIYSVLKSCQHFYKYRQKINYTVKLKMIKFYRMELASEWNSNNLNNGVKAGLFT